MECIWIICGKNNKKGLSNDSEQWEDDGNDDMEAAPITWNIKDQNVATNGIISKEKEGSDGNNFILQEIHKENNKETYGNDQNLDTNRNVTQIQEHTEGRHAKNKEQEYKKDPNNFTLQRKTT